MSEMLKISDLAVGDWVLDGNNNPAQILAIENWSDGYVLNVQIKDVGIGVVAITRVRPIAITPEILENNGFRCIAVGDNGPSTPRQNYMRYEKWRVETLWGYRDLFFDRMTKRYRFSGMNEYTFTEVHKLQHALRFSNFEKEIIL